MSARILIVDDEKPISRFSQNWLADEGYSTEVAGDGEEALEKSKMNHSI